MSRMRLLVDNRVLRLGVVLLLTVATAWGQSQDTFAIQKIWFDKKGDGYGVKADLQVGQTQMLDKILRGGDTVKLNFELRFIQRIDWLPDRQVGDISWNGSLSYDTLTRHYLFVSNNRQTRYKTLTEVVADINQLRAGTNNDSEFIKLLLREDVYLSARFYIDTGNLPTAMQIGLLIDNPGFNSGWLTFPLTRHE